MTADKVKLEINPTNVTSIRTLLSEANNIENEAANLLLTAGERYENVLLILKESLVPWNKVVLSLQTLVFKEWPMKETGRPLGIQAAMDQAFPQATWVNRFNAYRVAKYTDYGVLKVIERPPKMVDLTPEQRQKKRIETAKENTKKRISMPHVISRDLIKHDLFEIFTFAMKTGNDSALTLCKQLYASLGFTESITELNEIVETPTGDLQLPTEKPVTDSATTVAVS